MRPVFFATTIAMQTVAIGNQQCFNKGVSREREPASSMKTSLFDTPRIALIAILGCALSGCAPKPQVDANASIPTAKASAPQQTTLGGFNIHKRHGLGGWEGSTGPSEQQLLQQMRNQSAKSHPEKPFKSEPGKENP